MNQTNEENKEEVIDKILSDKITLTISGSAFVLLNEFARYGFSVLFDTLSEEGKDITEKELIPEISKLVTEMNERTKEASK